MSTRPSIRHVFLVVLLSAAVLGPAGCDRGTGGASAPPYVAQEAPSPANRVDIPPAVRQNLGITFAKVESRAVARTLRLPGRFELLPTARRKYRAIVPGTLELLVSQYQAVEAGTPLYRIDSPRWREAQREMVDAFATLRLAEAGVDSIGPLFDAHEQHHTEVERAVDLWTERVATLDKLQAAGGVRGDEVAQARVSLSSARADLAETLETEAELQGRRLETAATLDAARARLAFLFQAAATTTGLSVAELKGVEPSTGEPRWTTLDRIEIRSLTAGIVETLHAVSGGVVDQHAPVLTVVQPDLIRFRAAALQSDLPRLSAGLPGTVAPPHDALAGKTATFTGTLTLAPVADSERRTIEVILSADAQSSAGPPTWARAGVSAFLEVITAGSGREETAIPLRCVARDGTQSIIFRRDPANPDKAIRMEADLGINDGEWVVIRSGVAEGNEIVLDGVYQLMVATSGSITRGGHFHADGTFHEGHD